MKPDQFVSPDEELDSILFEIESLATWIESAKKRFADPIDQELLDRIVQKIRSALDPW